MILIFILNLVALCQYNEPVLLDQLNSNKNEYAPAYNSSENILYFNSEVSGKVKFYTTNWGNELKKSYLNDNLNDISNISYLSFIDEENAIVSSFIKYPSQAKLNLFYVKKIKKSWIREKSIDEINGDFFILNASISSDKTFMIFSSNFGNELKDTDLFMTFKNERGKWETPISISELNSTGSEITPLLVGNDSLYFASNGQGGQGGFDIFLSVKVLGKWQRPILIDGINSSYNDSDPCIINDKIVFASDRPGGKGKYDLYFSELKLNNKNINKDIEYDISISTFVTNINVKTQSKIKNSTIYPYIHFDENDTKIENSYKERNLTTLNAIATFIKLGNSIELNVWTQNVLESQKEINSKYISDQRIANILLFLKEKYNINNDKVHINYFYSDNVKDYIFIYSKDKFMSISQESEKKIIIEPENLIYQLDISPENVFTAYNIDLCIGEKYHKQILTSKENPLNSKIDLNNYSALISGSDSLKLIINIKNDDATPFSKEFLYQINNSYEKISDKTAKTDFSFFLIASDDIKDENFYKNLIVELKSKLNKTNYIIESSYNLNEFKSILEKEMKVKFNIIENDKLGKEVIIR